jgi:hypothetical protein
MITTNANVPAVPRRRLSPWAAIVAGIAGGFTIGLLTAKSFSLGVSEPKATVVAAKVNQPAAADAPEPFKIVPSPVIEPHPQFFYGTGDGNGGYQSDR